MVRFGQHTTGREVVQACAQDIDGKIVVITGPSDGTIGGTLLLDLAAAKPAKIFLVGRSVGKVQPTIDKFKQENASAELVFVKADLDDLESMRKAAENIKSQTARIDVLFNNAGVMATPYQKTKQGHEWQFGVNHLSHFVFTAHLMPLIEAAAPGSVIVNTSSTGCELGGIPYDDITWRDGATYNPWKGYGASKTANAQFALQLAKKYGSKGIKAFSIQPGMPPSHLQDNLPKEGPGSLQDGLEINAAMHGGQASDVSGDMKSLEAATSTMLAAAFDRDLEQYSGKFLRNCDLYSPDPHVLDPAGAERLWKLSEELTGESW